MPGGSKKKKTKPAGNPLRGFQTTSVPKASIVDVVKDEDIKTASGTVTPDTAPTSIDSEEHKKPDSGANQERELHELSPEELEARLEVSELQQFVEQHAVKVRKDAARVASRLVTDKRLFRGQAELLPVKAWLPEELIQQLLDLVLSEEALDQRPLPRHKVPAGDDLLAKVWTLRTCLHDLDFETKDVNDALSWLLKNPPPAETGGTTWGLGEVLDWLALHAKPNNLRDYDNARIKATAVQIQDDDGLQGEEPGNTLLKDDEKKQDSVSGVRPETGRNVEPADFDVSELESDCEPDELMSIYLRTKARLFETNPALVEVGKGNKKRNARKSGPTGSEAASGGEKKLLQKMQKIESDVLFDQREADYQWSIRSVDLARETAERNIWQLSQEAPKESKNGSSSASGAPQPSNISEEAERLGREMLRQSADDEDEDLLSGMFDALPGIGQTTEPTSRGGATQANVVIRDFGRWTGMSPKRIVEEACKSRDSGVKLNFKLISPTIYASRHSLTINWSKDQQSVEAAYLPDIQVRSRPRLTVISMLGQAAPDESQSEALIATHALFLIFAGSPKEEKAHMKLPPPFRDVWTELSAAKQEHGDAADRDTVKELRSLVEQASSKQEESEAEDEVVFKAGNRHRSAVVSGVSTPAQEKEPAVPMQASVELSELWARKASTPAYQKMLVARMNLPIFHFKAAALEVIRRHPITILVSETGSGKSTQLPAYILEQELSHGRPCKIYCTEPRRISAISLARRVSEEMGERNGDVGTSRSLVGYAVRLESHTSHTTRLVYATTGIVLRMLESADGLSDITHLVIDEVHERSIDTDFLLIMLRALRQRRPDLRVVLMSATVNAQKFSDYLDGAPIIDVPGRTFPVEAKFLEDAIELTGHTNEDVSHGGMEEDNSTEPESSEKSAGGQLAGYTKRTLKTLLEYDEYRIDFNLIVKLLQKVAYDPEYSRFSHAILVFLPGIAEIRQLNDMLGGHPAFGRDWKVYPLHSSFSSEDQQAAFEVPPQGMRKIVLATNIAETGITIPDITCVVDTGKHREMRFDEKRQLSRLIMSFIARANAKQRRGRAGRVQEGICFHLVTKHRHDELMAESQTPEMLRLSLQELCMRVKICRLGDIETALSKALDPPSSRNIRRAIDALVDVEALTVSEELTPLGLQLAKLPLDAQLGKLVLLGSIFGCLDFTLTVAATLSSKSPFLSPMHAKKQADTVRLGFKRGDSDLGTVYNAYCSWRNICKTAGIPEYRFCNANFLSPQNLANIEDLKAQLLTSLVDAGFVRLDANERSALSRIRPGTRQRNFVELPERYCSADDDDKVIASVVAWSFYPKIIKRDGKGWRNIANNQTLALHPSSVNKNSLSPDTTLLSFYSIMQSSSKYTNAQETTPAPEMALVLLAGDAVFHMYAGVIVIDGNRLRYKVRDWKTMIVLNMLRTKLKEVQARVYKVPGKELGGKQMLWFDVLGQMFELQRKK
ncbi:hypothetical protein LTR91_004897 [Friedmanniomyces endolithicus]|uniref:RNA helicase n=1 Tax=Friedmanniomyces endolithicus TaxID=329885 RepID=A0AAN6QY41_9PEZI|nr:hypothetical protein LTR57_007911 [Friedmanniomyces endolithicus]KAK1002755.1 hypothetical protein LTR91_004897 [Friedmanniomyces endolithicus]KAK1008913.1 hypothetical protein LTS01_002186 [Friedmanniomyces endolithicus]KAK1036999.1 hypothetical protein LTS16_013265 [Friedmanniomyces endolithicus]